MTTSPSLHVLGSCAAWPEPGRACSGYVLEHHGAHLVLDLGLGTLPRLLRIVPDLTSIVGIVISHAHPDHMSDLIGLCRASALTGHRDPWPLVAPDNVLEVVAAGDPEDGRSVVARTLRPATAPLTLGPFEVSTCPTPHYLPNLAVRVEVGDASIVYTGDTGPSPDLAAFARDVDLLLTECTDRHQQGGTPDDATRRNLLTASAAGRLGTDAHAKSLVLTHFWPGNDREASVTEAQGTYAGPVDVADENRTSGCSFVVGAGRPRDA